jgi:hypothetical protein
MNRCWFTIDNSGFKARHANRPLGHLVREAVSNAFDSAGAKTVRVTLDPGIVSVRDDGDGVSDVSLLTTVFMTSKQDSHLKRGRKGLGIKEFISAGESATISTSSGTVMFNNDGTRHDGPPTVTSGTEVTVHNSEWDGQKLDEAEAYLSGFEPPPGIQYFVNGSEIKHRETDLVIESVCLDTVVFKNDVQTSHYEHTKLILRKRRSGENTSTLFEMGIPVCTITCPWHVDVQQRIPLNDMRDAVSSTYWLNKMYAVVLNEKIEFLKKSDLQAAWVIDSLSSVSSNTKRAYAKKIVGDMACRKSPSAESNRIAKANGMTVVNTEDMPYQVASALEDVLPTAAAVAEEIEKARVPVVNLQANLENVRQVVLYEHLFKSVLQREIKVEFVSLPKSHTGDTTTYVQTGPDGIGFNVESDISPEKPFSPKMIAVMTRAIAALSDTPEAIAESAGMLLQTMWDERDTLECIMGDDGAAIARTEAVTGGKLVQVKCTAYNCKNVKLVKPSQAFTTKYCIKHQSTKNK